MKDNKRLPRNLLVLISICILMFTVTGLSIWIITDVLNIKPNEDDKNANDIIIEYLGSQTGTYNGNILLPSNEALGLNIESERLTYSFRQKESTEDFVLVDLLNTQGPINADEYIIKVECIDPTNFNNIISEELEFTINPRDISDANVEFNRIDNNLFYVGHTYNDFIKDLNISIVLNEFSSPTQLVLDTDFTITSPDLVTVQSTNTIIEGKGNFSGTKNISYQIKMPELVAVVNTNENFYLKGSSYMTVFTGEEIPLDVIVKDSFGYEIKNATVVFSYSVRGKDEFSIGLPIDCQYYTINIAMSAPNYEDKNSSVDVYVNRADLKDVTITVTGNYVYNNSEIKPTSSNLTVEYGEYGELEAGVDYSIQGYENNIDAGQAIINISGRGNFSGSTSGYFNIERATPVITLPTYKYIKNYMGVNRGWYIEGFEPIVANRGKASFTNGNSVVEDIDGELTSNAKNQIFGVGDNAIKEVEITYTFVPKDPKNFNYSYVNDHVVMLAVGYNTTTTKYYGTVEKATLANTTTSGTKVYVLSNVFELTGYYPTITTEELNVSSNVSLILPYGITKTENVNEAGNLTGITYGEFVDYVVFNDGDSYSGTPVTTKPSYLMIGSDSKINFSSGSQLIVGSYVLEKSISSFNNSAMILNDGTITLYGSSKVYAYGFIKGKGTFNLEKESTCYDLFAMPDFPGARYAAGMYYNYYHGGKSSKMSYNNIMPFQSYSFHNISCKLNIKYGAFYYAKSQINVSNKIYSQNVLIFGSSDSALFKIESSNGHIYREVKDYKECDTFNTDFSLSNQLIEQKEIYKFFTNVKDGSINVSMTIIAVNVSITTSTSLAMPIGLMELIVCKGYTLTINKNSYKFLPGSKVIIEEGAVLDVANSETNIIFYDEYHDNFTKDGSAPADFSYHQTHSFLYNGNSVINDYKTKIIVNGTLKSVGKIGGIITTTGTTGKITLSSGNATLKRLESISRLTDRQATKAGITLLGFGSAVHFNGSVKDHPVNAQLYLQDGNNISSTLTNASSGTYVAVGDTSGNYGWVKS